MLFSLSFIFGISLLAHFFRLATLPGSRRKKYLLPFQARIVSSGRKTFVHTTAEKTNPVRAPEKMQTVLAQKKTYIKRKQTRAS